MGSKTVTHFMLCYCVLAAMAATQQITLHIAHAHATDQEHLQPQAPKVPQGSGATHQSDLACLLLGEPQWLCVLAAAWG